MAFAFVPGAQTFRVPVSRPRPGPRGMVTPGKAFNHFPQIIAAFPGAVEGIVIETTMELAGISAAMAPTQQNPRPGDPAPGTLKQSVTTTFFQRRGTDMVQTGKVAFPAKTPSGHRYAKPLETGSIRRSRKGLVRVTKGSGWLVDAIMAERPPFIRKLSNLESRLPR